MDVKVAVERVGDHVTGHHLTIFKALETALASCFLGLGHFSGLFSNGVLRPAGYLLAG